MRGNLGEVVDGVFVPPAMAVVWLFDRPLGGPGEDPVLGALVNRETLAGSRGRSGEPKMPTID